VQNLRVKQVQNTLPMQGSSAPHFFQKHLWNI
jgi:hypothetical protein